MSRRATGLALALCAAAACHRDVRAVPPGDARRAAPARSAAATPKIAAAAGRAPEGVRIKVEVLNATRNRGLARRVALYLRDRGYDVVGVGTSGRAQSNTVVLDRSNHPEWARLIATALAASVQERPDTSRYLDATVILGTDWVPPALPFYP